MKKILVLLLFMSIVLNVFSEDLGQKHMNKNNIIQAKGGLYLPPLATYSGEILFPIPGILIDCVYSRMFSNIGVSISLGFYTHLLYMVPTIKTDGNIHFYFRIIDLYTGIGSSIYIDPYKDGSLDYILGINIGLSGIEGLNIGIESRTSFIQIRNGYSQFQFSPIIGTSIFPNISYNWRL